MEVIFRNSVQSRFEFNEVLGKLGSYLQSHGVETLVNASLESPEGETLKDWKGKVPFQKIQEDILAIKGVSHGWKVSFKCWHSVGILKELIVDVDSRRHVACLRIDLSDPKKDFEIETQSTGWGVTPVTGVTEHSWPLRMQYPWLLYVLIGVVIAIINWW